MASSFVGPWTGSQDQVNQMASLYGTTFTQNQPLQGPYTYGAASNNLWVNPQGQSAALLWDQATRYGPDQAKTMYQTENQSLGPSVVPAYNISQQNNQPTIGAAAAPKAPVAPSITGGAPTGQQAPAQPFTNTPTPTAGSAGSGGLNANNPWSVSAPPASSAPQTSAYGPYSMPYQGYGGYSPNFASMYPSMPGSNGGSFQAQQTNDLGWLQGIATNAGYQNYGAGSGYLIPQLMGQAPGMSSLQQLAVNGNPTNATDAWQAMIAAQQANQDRQAADLAEKFNMSGNRFSTAFGDAASQFQNQALLDQNSLLGQMTLQSLESAAGRQANAAGQLAGYSASAAGQLGGQDFQSAESARQRELQAAGQLGSQASQAASQLSSQDYGSQMAQYNAMLQAALSGQSGQDQAALALAGFGAQGAQQLLGNSMNASGQVYGAENQAANNMFGASNQAAGQMYNGQMSLLPQMMQYDLGQQQLGIQGANSISNLWNQNLQTGNNIGNSQWGMNEQNLNALYQEWLRQQSAYSPYLPYMYQAGTAQPLMYTPGYAPSGFGQTLAGFGQLATGLGAILHP